MLKQKRNYKNYDCGEWWFGGIFFGGLTGCVLGFYEASKCDRGDLFRRGAFPVMGTALGIAGGMVPPLGGWWLYNYVRKKNYD